MLVVTPSRQRSGLRTTARHVALALILACAARAHAQRIHGTVSSAVASGRVPGAVVLLLDSGLTTFARALTSDSGTFSISAGTSGRFHLKVMRIGFRPTESATFDLQRDTTIDVALADIPVILPAVTTRDRNDCRLHPDTSDVGQLTFALWEQARTALLAAAITLEQHDYRFDKLLHLRVYDTGHNELREVALHELESRGSAPWASLPAEQLRHDGYMTQDDSGLTFYAPDLDVLLSPYFTQEHCFHLTSSALPPPDSGFLGLDFEPAARPRHVEIRGTLWIDAASKELRWLRFAFVNLPVSPANDTLLGGHVEFTRLAGGAWILPSWSIRMPTPVRSGLQRTISSVYGWRSASTSRGSWRLTTDVIRIQGGDLRAVKRGALDDSVLWRRPTGSARITALASDTAGFSQVNMIVRLAGSPYAGHTDVQGQVRFEQMLPGTYLFEATTPLHDALDATAERTSVTVRAGERVEAVVRLKPLARAAAEVCDVSHLDRNTGVIAGHVLRGDESAAHVHVTAEWPGGDASMESREDGYYRFCGVPTGKLVLVKASRDKLMATTTLTLDPHEIVRPLELRIQP